MMSGHGAATGFAMVAAEAGSPEDLASIDHHLYANEKIVTKEECGGKNPPAGVYRRGPNGSLIKCSGEYFAKGNLITFTAGG